MAALTAPARVAAQHRSLLHFVGEGRWSDDAARRRKAGVPDDVTFMTKPQIALAQISAAHAAGLPQGVVLMDAGHGVDAKLRLGISEFGLA